MNSVGVVPAVFKEWGPFGSTQFFNEPFWMAHTPFQVFRYQRRNPELKNYIPNMGFEMGVFLHHIVNKFETLNDITIFVQADVLPEFMYSSVCVNKNATFTPLRSLHHTPQFERVCSWWTNKTYEKDVWNCFHRYLNIFGLDTTLHPPCPRFYSKNNFAVSKKNIHRFPLSTWKRAYDLVINGKCMSSDLTIGKHVSGATEFTSNLIFGNKSIFSNRYTMNVWKEQYDWKCITNCLNVSPWPYSKFSCVPLTYIAMISKSSVNIVRWRILGEGSPRCWSFIHEGLVIC